MARRGRKRAIRGSGPARIRRLRWIVLAIALIVGLGLSWRWSASSSNASKAAASWPVPDPDVTDREELVVEIVVKARDGVLKLPDSSRSWRNFAAVLDAHEYWADAEVAYRRAIELAPDDWWCAYNLALVLESRGRDADEILALYRRFAEVEPDYPPVRERIAMVLAQKGDLRGSAEAHRVALTFDPKLTIARRALGQVLITLGDAPGAIPELERVAKEAPTDGPTQAALARAYTLTGDAARASAAAARAKELKDTLVVPDPVRLEVVNRGRSASLASARAADRMKAGDYAGALEDLKIVLRSTPERPTLHERLATVYRQLGQEALAEKHQQEAERLRAGR